MKFKFYYGNTGAQANKYFVCYCEKITISDLGQKIANLIVIESSFDTGSWSVGYRASFRLDDINNNTFDNQLGFSWTRLFDPNDILKELLCSK